MAPAAPLQGASQLTRLTNRPDIDGLRAVAIVSVVAYHVGLPGVTGGYFDNPSGLNPLLHLWSLAVEEQFYLVWPLVLLLATRCAPVRARRTWRMLAIAAITVGSFVLGLRLRELGNWEWGR